MEAETRRWSDFIFGWTVIFRTSLRSCWRTRMESRRQRWDSFGPSYVNASEFPPRFGVLKKVLIIYSLYSAAHARSRDPLSLRVSL